MRTNWGPNKGHVELPAPPELSVGVVTHYLNHPYHKDRIEVVKLCIDSLLNGLHGVSYELILWDNGSTPEFIRMLEGYRPHVLVKSYNIGVDNAQVAISGLARGRYLCLCDDDILFHPDWYVQQKRVIETYPKVGVVSGSPQRTAFRWAVKSNVEWGQKNAALQVGRFIPDEWERDFCISIGRDPEKHLLATAQEQDYLLTYKGVKAWAHGHHMQWLAERDTALKFIGTRKCDVYLGNAHVFNNAIDNAGYLNLTTYARTAVHIGNAIDESVANIMRAWGLLGTYAQSGDAKPIEAVDNGRQDAAEVME